ncbi:MAG: MBL fold metallo-hydrolase [Bacillota bacterium]|nr:MBL fold metallo-hydrolase [Bacillota bacterium]
MIIDTLGHIRNNLYNLGLMECPIFLLDGPEPVIFDAGVSCAGNIYVEAIRSILGDRQPSVLFLTHAHWDHCGAASHLKKAFPQMKVAAPHLAVDILKLPNALALIKMLNDDTTARMSSSLELDSSLLTNESFCTFEIDIELTDNQILDVGEGTTVQALATPGHTRDHYSYYLPKEKILIAGEAGGVYYGPETVSTEFVSDYDAYVASLKRLAALPTEVFCQGHYHHLVGTEEISAFFKRSLSETIHFKERVLELLDEESGSIDRVMERVKTERYDVIPGLKQPEVPYLLNLKAQVTHLAGKEK